MWIFFRSYTTNCKTICKKNNNTKSLWVYQYLNKIKVKHLLTLWPRNSTPIYPREMKTYTHKKMCTRKFIDILFILVKKWGENVHHQENGKTNVVYSSSGILALNKKEWTTIYTTWMDLRDTMLNERIQTQKNISWFPLYEFLQQANEVIASRREVGWERVSEDFLRLWRCSISG